MVPGGIATRWFDLDDIGAEIAQDATDKRPDGRTNVQDFDPVEHPGEVIDIGCDHVHSLVQFRMAVFSTIEVG
jgi:hypothetical protein